MVSKPDRTIVFRWTIAATLIIVSSKAWADQVIADNLIVQGSLCVGVDCASGESFGAVTILLKESNNRIKFDDTSTGGPPDNDWQLTANDDSEGTLNRFSIEDLTSGTVPFTVLARAPTNSFLMDSLGRVGLGTDSPALKLQLTLGDTPGLRLEQDASNGFTAQTWDVAGNEANFFVRDVTAGNRLPFRVRPGAPTSSIDIAANGNVGFGTPAPGAVVHVLKAPQASTGELLARFEVSDDSMGSLQINNASTTDGIFIPRIVGRSGLQNAAMVNEAVVSQDAGSSPAIAYNAYKAAGGPLATRPLVAYRNNGVAKATIAANGAINATSFNPTSSRALKNHIVDLDSQKASDALRQLTPVEYVYKDDSSGEKRVGFIAEDVPEIVANADRQSVPIMDVLALVTKVVKDQQQTIDQQRRSIEEQNRNIEQLMKRLSALERQMPEAK